MTKGDFFIDFQNFQTNKNNPQASFTGLLKKTRSYLTTSDIVKLIFSTIFNIFIGFVDGFLLMNIDENLMLEIFIFVNVLSVFVGYFNSKFTTEIGLKIANKFYQEFVTTWAKLNFKSSTKINSDKMYSKAREAKWCYIHICTSGFSDLINLFSKIFVGIIVIYSNKAYLLGFFFIIINFITYKFVITKINDKLDEVREIRKELEVDLDVKINISCQQMMLKTANPYFLIDALIQKNKYELNEWDYYNKINFSTEFANKIIFFFLLTIPRDKSTLLTMLLIIGKMAESSSRFTNFTTWFDRMNSRYDEFVNLWEKTEYEMPTEDKNVPEILKIKNVNISDGSMTIKSQNEDLGLVIKQGKNYITSGLSGNGKTTFWNEVFFGFGDQVQVVDGNENKCNIVCLRKSILFCLQKITDFTNTLDVPLISLFKDLTDPYAKPNENLVRESLQIIGMEKFIDQLDKQAEKNYNDLINKLSKEKEQRKIRKIQRSIDAYKNTMIDGKPNGLYEKLGSESGGEKQRICLAVFVIYKLLVDEFYKKNNIKICFLDEPFKAVDPKTGYESYKRIFARFKNITFIVICHLEKITEFNYWESKISTPEKGIIVVDSLK